MYNRVRRFLNGHYEELLPEFIVLALWLVAGLMILERKPWPF